MPSLFPEGMFIFVAGCADDPVAGRGAGTPFQIQSDATTPTTETFTFSLMDWVYFSGGGILWQGAQMGDWCSLRIVAPPTQIAPNLSHTGSADLVGGYVVPNLGHTGAYDVTSPVPLQALDAEGNPAGQWDWSAPDTGFGVVTPGEVGRNGQPSGGWVMTPSTVPLAQFIARFQLVGSGHWDLSMPFIKPGRILPHWQVQVLLHNSGHAGLALSWQIVTARMRTV